MGFFSRKDKSHNHKAKPALVHSNSNTSLHSGSSIKSPAPTSNFGRSYRTSAGTGTSSGPGTPLTPFSPAHSMAKVDIPRPPDPQLDPVGYLRSLNAVRERCSIVTDKALRNDLHHFDVDMAKFSDVVTFVASIIKRDYDAPFTSIPPHGRHQHFAVGGRDRVAHLLSTFPEDVDPTERCRRLVDLFLVSVLLDAGAGTQWSYKSAENGRVYRRSEGIAVASLEMFKTTALRQLTVDQLAHGLQSKPGNVMAGLEGRTSLLVRLADALDQKKEFFGEDGRPGNLLDYLLQHPLTQASSTVIVPIPVLWDVLLNGLMPIWPASRTAVNGISLGDAWPCSSMPQPTQPPSSPTFSPFPNSSGQAHTVAPWESILPFHKLTQWLTYSLMQPMQSIMKIHFAGPELLTGLPEYRNGGLFIDLGVLTLKKNDETRGLQNYAKYCERTGSSGIEVAPMFEPGDDVIVEWRGVTVGFLDKLCVEINRVLAPELAGNELSLPQVLEAGSWKGGREMAEMSRPNTKEPPILIDSDGTVF
ncbi:hypothetical protein GE09DRAFT_1179361 [Coniochaeta sp. 2T2.1]|nr:hypothetical protein GE09DRAFT_1179361 [Coniochaeta sp. 2T2.1]